MARRELTDQERPGWSQGYLCGKSRAGDHCREQEHTLERVILDGEEAMRVIAEVAYQREARHYASYRGPSFRRRFVDGWVRGYVAGVTTHGKPPLYRRCAVCRYDGEAVHIYALDWSESQNFGRYECDDLDACLLRVAAQRGQRRRLFGEHVYAL